MRHKILVLVALLLAGNATQAATPEATIRGGVEKVQALIDRNHSQYMADSASYYAMVDKVMLPYFDLQRVGKLTLGSHWQSATSIQRQRLAATFKSSMVHSYADAVLAQQDSLSIDWADSAAPTARGDAIVKATLKRKNQRPIALGFSVGLSNGQWRIHDVALDGVSLGAGLRAQFKSEIAKNGLEGLIQRLESNSRI